VRRRAVWAGVPREWSTGDVLGVAWNGFKANWGVVFFAQLLAVAIQYAPDLLRGLANGAGLIVAGSTEDNLLSAANTVLGLALTAFLNAGLLTIYLKVARGQAAALGDVVGGARRFLPMLAMSILYNIAIVLGLLLLVVPGIVLAVGLQLADVFVVDAELGAVDALRASWEVTKGHKVQLFVFNIVCGFAILGGLLACGVGVIAALAITRIAEVIVYLRISGRADPPPVDAGAPPPPLPMPMV
jgi:uncharacterized membrane protein